MTKYITEHVGKKYIRKIRGWSKTDQKTRDWIYIDVYRVIEAFSVTCPALQHALKKILCAGKRDKGSVMQDLTDIEAAVANAISLQQDREDDTDEVYAKEVDAGFDKADDDRYLAAKEHDMQIPKEDD